MILKNVIIIVLGFQMMLNITRPLITLYAASLGADTFEIGLLTATYAAFPVIFAVYVGKIADQVGDRLPVFLGSIGLTAGMAFPYFFPYMWSLYVSQAALGISQMLIAISLQNVLGNTATNENRDRYFSMFSMWVAVSGIIGPVVGGYLAQHFSYLFAFFVSMLIGFVPITFSFFIPNIIRLKEKANDGVFGSLNLLKIRVLNRALASSALVLYSRDIYVAYFPLFAAQLGISISTIGWIVAIQGLTLVAVRFFLAKLSESFGRNRILFFSILVAGISFLLFPFSNQVYWFGFLSALMGAGLGCGQPLSMTTLYNASPKTRTGEVMGLRVATNRLSQLIAPLFFGLIGSWAGLISVFFVSGAFLIGGAFLTRPDKEQETTTDSAASPD